MSDPDVPARPPATERVTVLERVERMRRDPRVGLAMVAIVVVAAAVVWMRSGSAGSRPPAAITTSSVSGAAVESTPTTATNAIALVHVVGAVRTPGVVELAAGGRVRDAVAAAGGPADDADLARVNLAAPVADGQRLAVPRLGEADPMPLPGESVAGERPAAGPLDLNTATASDLETLPGIGPTLAEAIVRAREQRGGFASVDDLKQVRGIGDARFADIRDLVSV